MVKIIVGDSVTLKAYSSVQIFELLNFSFTDLLSDSQSGSQSGSQSAIKVWPKYKQS